MTPDFAVTPQPSQIFLTGATGFLGSHLLRALLDQRGTTVTCLVRGDDLPSAERALERQLAFYFPELVWPTLRERIRIVRGDLEAPLLGLERAQFESLAASQGAIVHAGANVNHVGAASRSFRANTESVSTLIALARLSKPKPFHHISTASVQGEFQPPPPIAAFKETHLEEGQVFSAAYSESKFQAEVLLRKAFAEGLPGTVYRVGYVGPHSVTGRYQRNIEQSNTARWVRACVRLGFAPYLPEETVQLTPVDSVASAVIAIMTGSASTGRTYYVDHPRQLTLYEVLRVLHAAGYAIRLMEPEEFSEKAGRLSRDTESLGVVSPDVRAHGPHAIPTDSSWSQRELSKLGFEYPEITGEWFGRFLQHAIEVGFIEAPRFWHAAKPVGALI